jgi:hypothetical protein
MVAILFTGSAIFAVQKNRIFATSAVATNAEVVEIQKERRPETSPKLAAEESSDSKFVTVPVFQYKVDGAVFERRAEPRYNSADVSYSVGDTTVIYYNPENPSEVRDVLRPDASTAPTLLGGIAAIAWFLFAAFSIHSFRILRFEARGRKPTNNAMTETKSIFIALEATNERLRGARQIRLVCRWVHPETGVEHLLRSASIHPTELPPDLELGALISCKLDFDNPMHHEVMWTQRAAVADAAKSRTAVA